MKRRITGFLAVILCFILFCSCAGPSAPADGSKMSENDESEKLSCEGYVFRVLQPTNKDRPFGYEAGSTYADMMNAHVASKEAELGFTLQYLSKGDNSNIAEELTRYSASGLAETSIVAWDDGNQMTQAFAGAFYPLPELEGILDYTDPKFGGWGMLSLCMAHGIPYGVTPVLWPMMTSTTCFVTVFFNGEYIKKLGLPTPWEYYEQGKWNYGLFGDVLDQYAFTEGETKFPAFITNIWNFCLGAWSANGVHMVGEDTAGKLIAGYETERGQHAVEWIKRTVIDHKDSIKLVTDYLFDDNFVNGESTMMVFDTDRIPKVAANMKDFGIAPFPIGPDITEKDRVYLCSFGYSIQIPNEVDDPEITGCILNSLCDPFDGYETEDSLIDLLYSTAFFNRDQAALYADMYKRAEPTYQGLNGHAAFLGICNQITSKKSAAELLDKSRNSMDSVIDKYLGENYRYLKEIGFYQ